MKELEWKKRCGMLQHHLLRWHRPGNTHFHYFAKVFAVLFGLDMGIEGNVGISSVVKNI